MAGAAAVAGRAAQRLERLGLITSEDRQHSRLGPIVSVKLVLLALQEP